MTGDYWCILKLCAKRIDGLNNHLSFGPWTIAKCLHVGTHSFHIQNACPKTYSRKWNVALRMIFMPSSYKNAHVLIGMLPVYTIIISPNECRSWCTWTLRRHQIFDVRRASCSVISLKCYRLCLLRRQLKRALRKRGKTLSMASQPSERLSVIAPVVVRSPSLFVSARRPRHFPVGSNCTRSPRPPLSCMACFPHRPQPFLFVV